MNADGYINDGGIYVLILLVMILCVGGAYLADRAERNEKEYRLHVRQSARCPDRTENGELRLLRNTRPCPLAHFCGACERHW